MTPEIRTLSVQLRGSLFFKNTAVVRDRILNELNRKKQNTLNLEMKIKNIFYSNLKCSMNCFENPYVY